MVHVTYDVDKIQLEDFFQEGYGGLYFEGIPYQRGYGVQYGAGVGDIFRSFIRFLMPYARQAGHAIKKEGVATSTRILQDIAQGSNFKDAVLTESKAGFKNLKDKAVNKFKQQTGTGKRRKRIHKNRSLIGRSVSRTAVNKRRRADSLGFY